MHDLGKKKGKIKQVKEIYFWVVPHHELFLLGLCLVMSYLTVFSPSSQSPSHLFLLVSFQTQPNHHENTTTSSHGHHYTSQQLHHTTIAFALVKSVTDTTTPPKSMPPLTTTT